MTIIRTAALLLMWGSLTAQSFPPPLSEQEAREVREAIEAMRRDPRGPYLRIRWFCADSTVQPPQGTPCRERGGGVQHAEFNQRALRLAQLHVHVGTILQALPFEQLYDAAHDHYRLKELVLARYLFETDDGWALRRARYYRGARQIEDEEARGQQYLQRLLADTAWTRRNFLLASQLVGTIPHAALGGAQLTQRIRNLASEVAEQDAGFLNVRIKIHAFPSADDLAAVERYLAARGHPPETRDKLSELLDALRAQYDPRRRAETLARYERRLRQPLGEELAGIRRSHEVGDTRTAFARIADLAPRVSWRVTASTDGRTNLILMDLLATLGEQAFALAQELERDPTPFSRADRLRALAPYFALAHAAGFLSGRERLALEEAIARLTGDSTPTAMAYKDAVSYLSRSVDWATGTARGVFAPLEQRYLQFEPKAIGFVDAVLRGSALLPLSLALERLASDADRVLGASHRVLGREVSQGARGLNPGLAVGPLELVDPARPDWELQSTTIYVIPETTPELRPPAGVLTLDAGNLLSHVQLLARNLGIPNASISSSFLPLLQEYRGREVFYAVSPLGLVVLEDTAVLGELERSLLDASPDTTSGRIVLDASQLRLDRAEPIPLAELRAAHSGVFVGPKAGNLGQLAADFPGRVSRGVALPFGMFYRHANRPYQSERSVLEEVEDAYAQAAWMRENGYDESDIDGYMFGVLARVREAILQLDWLPGMREAVVDALRTTFAGDVSGGVFIRSDTNVEDLPQFTGAGLNLTVPHRRSEEEILAAVRRVWTSPFSERAYLWRKRILQEQGRIYPSVLLQESVHSEKSGVLISTGLGAGDGDDLTIVTAEGGGGGVEGEAAETIVVDSETGAITLLSQTKAPFRRALVDSGPGGVRMIPARRPDQLLTDDEIRQLRDVVAEWKARLPESEQDQAWDIEFGFVGGRLWLFQIRPFVRSRGGGMSERLGVLDRRVEGNGGRPISLEEVL
jgi:hypothetical protein